LLVSGARISDPPGCAGRLQIQSYSPPFVPPAQSCKHLSLLLTSKRSICRHNECNFDREYRVQLETPSLKHSTDFSIPGDMTEIKSAVPALI
jgi:hypothetical protein